MDFGNETSSDPSSQGFAGYVHYPPSFDQHNGSNPTSTSKVVVIAVAVITVLVVLALLLIVLILRCIKSARGNDSSSNTSNEHNNDNLKYMPHTAINFNCSTGMLQFPKSLHFFHFNYITLFIRIITLCEFHK